VTIKRKLPSRSTSPLTSNYSGVRKNGYLHTDRPRKKRTVTIF